jgi:hypothetical protein
MVIGAFSGSGLAPLDGPIEGRRAIAPRSADEEVRGRTTASSHMASDTIEPFRHRPESPVSVIPQW